MTILKLSINVVYYTTYGLYRAVMSVSNILPRMLLGALKGALHM